VDSVHPAARRRRNRTSPAAAAEAAPAGDAAARVHRRDAAREPVADRHLRDQGHRARRAQARGREGQRPRRPVLDPHRAVDLQRHARRRSAARGVGVTSLRGTGDVTQNKQLLQHIFDELANDNSRPFIDSFADDVRWTIAGTTSWSRTYDGKTAVLEELFGPLRERLIERVKVQAHRLLADDDCVVVEASGTATTRNGRPYNNRYCWIFRLVEGKVRE